MNVERTDKEKLYIQLTDILMGRIRSGQWRHGSQIPTEEELCADFGVSKITVRRAVSNLVMEGHLEKIQGKGTFVRQGPPRAGLAMKTTLIESVFSSSDSQNIRVIDKKIITTMDDGLARRMGPVVDREIFYLSRLKIEEGVPVLVNELYIPLRVCPELANWDPTQGAVFEFLRDKSAQTIARVRQTVEVGRPGAHADSLNVRSSTACMIVHRVFMSPGDITVAYSRTTARPDRFHLDSEFVRLT